MEIVRDLCHEKTCAFAIRRKEVRILFCMEGFLFKKTKLNYTFFLNYLWNNVHGRSDCEGELQCSLPPLRSLIGIRDLEMLFFFLK